MAAQVERISVEELIPFHPKAEKSQTQETPDALRGLQPVKTDAADRILAASLGIFHAIGIIVAVRLLLLMVLVGAFSLSVMAMEDTGYHGLAVFIAYSVLIALPLIWLDRAERKKHPV